MTIQNIALTNQQAAFIEQLINSGEYENANEVLAKGLHLLEEERAEQAAKLEALRAEVQKGIDDIEAGRYTTFESPEALGAYLDSVAAEAIAEAEAELEAEAKQPA